MQLQAYKQDNSFHRAWLDDCLIYEDDDMYILASSKDHIIENNQRRWLMNEASLKILMKREFYNVIVMFRQDDINYYCNLASPALKEGNVIFYIDYDLDVKMNKHIQKIKLLDEKEFKINKEKYHYSEKLCKALMVTRNKIIHLMENQLFPFNDEKVRQLYFDFLACKEEHTHGSN